MKRLKIDHHTAGDQGKIILSIDKRQPKVGRIPQHHQVALANNAVARMERKNTTTGEPKRESPWAVLLTFFPPHFAWLIA